MKETKQTINWQEQFNKLVSIAKERYGYNVNLQEKVEDAVYHEKNKIDINSSYSYEICSYYLLHELGHVIQTKDMKIYHQQFGSIYDGLFSRSSLTRKVACLNEEFDAWNKGLQLAEYESIPVNKRRFEILKTKCLLTYIRWAAKEKKNNKGIEVHHDKQ